MKRLNRMIVAAALMAVVPRVTTYAQYGPVGFVNYNDGICGITGGMHS